MSESMSRRAALLALAGGVANVALSRTRLATAATAAHVRAANPPRAPRTPPPVLIRNVRVFDGVGAQFRPGSVLIADRQIRQIASGSIAAPSGRP
jgi:hypothetical protein